MSNNVIEDVSLLLQSIISTEITLNKNHNDVIEKETGIIKRLNELSRDSKIDSYLSTCLKVAAGFVIASPLMIVATYMFFLNEFHNEFMEIASEKTNISLEQKRLEKEYKEIALKKEELIRKEKENSILFEKGKKLSKIPNEFVSLIENEKIVFFKKDRKYIVGAVKDGVKQASCNDWHFSDKSKTIDLCTIQIM